MFKSALSKLFELFSPFGITKNSQGDHKTKLLRRGLLLERWQTKKLELVGKKGELLVLKVGVSGQLLKKAGG